MVEVIDSVTGVITKSETNLLVGGYMRCVHKIPILVTSTHPCTMHCISTDIAWNLGYFVLIWIILGAIVTLLI